MTENAVALPLKTRELHAEDHPQVDPGGLRAWAETEEKANEVFFRLRVKDYGITNVEVEVKQVEVQRLHRYSKDR